MERGGESLSPYPYMLVHEQYKTEQMLLDDLRAHGGEVMWETEIASLAESDGGVHATLRRAAGDEETLRARYVLGADGAHSFVRRHLDLPFEGNTYAQQLFLADVEMTWSLPHDKLYVEITRFGLLAFFPMPSKAHRDGYSDSQYRIVGSLTPEMASHEQATGNITIEDVQQTLNKYSVTGARVSDMNWASSYRIHRRMTEKFRRGRFFLAGDAAHIHSPAGGQGMNTGIQDAWNLAWKLALVVRGEASEALLDSYEPERVPVARTILNGTDRGFALQASPNPVARQLRYHLTPLLPFLTNNRWAGSQIFKLVSQTWIGYRDSAVVEGDRSTKAARPGDRAPHARFDAGPRAGESIFALLTGVDHHLLLFPGDATNNAVNGEAKRERIESLLSRYKIDTHVHVIDGAQRSLYNAYGVSAPSAFLVRPDGHIAWRGAVQAEGEPRGLAAYLERLFTRRDVAAEALSTAADRYLKELA